MPKPNTRNEFIAAICDHEQEVRRRILRGDSLSAVGRWLKELAGLAYRNPVYLFQLALPELPELVEAGKRNKQAQLEAGVVADRLAGLTYEQIRSKYHTDTKLMCKILAKHNLRTFEEKDRRQNSGVRRRYESLVGRVRNGFMVLRLLPRRRFGGKPEPWQVVVKCVDCGRRFQTSAAKVDKHEAACTCGNGGREMSERLVPIGAKPDAKIYCRCPSTACVLSEACHICCHECKAYDSCKYDRCGNSPDRCGQAAERLRVEEVM